MSITLAWLGERALAATHLAGTLGAVTLIVIGALGALYAYLVVSDEPRVIDFEEVAG